MLQRHHQDRDQHQLHDDAGDGIDDGTRPKERPRKCAVAQTEDNHLHNAPDNASRDHCTDQRKIDGADLLGEDAIQNAGYQTVGQKLKRHCDSGEDGRHSEENVAQQGSGDTDHSCPPRTAQKACQQYGQMHRTQRSADLWDLTGQKGKYQTQRKTDTGIGKIADLRIFVMSCIHRQHPFCVRWLHYSESAP